MGGGGGGGDVEMLSWVNELKISLFFFFFRNAVDREGGGVMDREV